MSKDLKDILEFAVRVFQDTRPKLTEEEQKSFESAQECQNPDCRFGKKFTEDNYKVRHHDHVSQKYIGAYCRKCNYFEDRKNSKLKIIFHNFKGYDGHFIIQHVHEIYKNLTGKGQFNIGTSSEKFSLIEFDNYCFMDSLQHLKGPSMSW